jgi:hypothetical protein
MIINDNKVITTGLKLKPYIYGMGNDDNMICRLHFGNLAGMAPP